MFLIPDGETHDCCENFLWGKKNILNDLQKKERVSSLDYRNYKNYRYYNFF